MQVAGCKRNMHPDGSFYFSYKVSGKTYYYAKPTDGDVTVTTY